MRDSLTADIDDIKFACTHCGQRIGVARSAAGLDVDCPICHNSVTVPRDESGAGPANGGSEVAEHPLPERSHHEPGLDHTRWKDLQEAQAEIGRQHALFKKAVEECERLKANATHVQAESKKFQADRQQLKADAAQAKQAAVTAETRATELDHALSETEKVNRALRERIENELAVLHERVAATETQLEVREKELRDGRAENAQILQALAQAQAEVSGLSAETAGLRKELVSQRQSAGVAAQQLAAAEQQLDETRTRLEIAGQAHLQSSQQRDEWQQQAEVLRRDLSASDSGRELLELRAKVQQLQQDHLRTETALTERATEAQTATATVKSLRAELQESRSLYADAERRAQAGSESQLMKDTEILRGIVDRQNATLGAYHSELRRLRRGRFALRLVYALFAGALLALGFFAFKTFDPQDFGRFFPH